METEHYTNEERMPKLFSNLGMQLTRRCNLKCKHCCQGGFDRTPVMETDMAIRFVKNASKIGCEQIGITGGEVFLEKELLSLVVDECSQQGLRCTVLTSAYWGKSRAKARAILDSLPGITTLAISYDTWHAEYVSNDKIVYAVEAALEANKSVSICSAFLKDGKEKQIGWLRNMLGSDLIDAVDLKLQPVLLHGDAEDNFTQCELFQYDLWSTRCTAAHKPLLAPDGTIYACCGASQDISGDHFLNLGSFKEEALDCIRDRAEANMALHAVRVDGPGRLAQEVGLASKLNIEPKDICEICTICCTHYSSSQINTLLEKNQDYMRSIAVKQLWYEGSVDSFLRVQQTERSIPPNLGHHQTIDRR